jgi:hypothetical protein
MLMVNLLDLGVLSGNTKLLFLDAMLEGER